MNSGKGSFSRQVWSGRSTVCHKIGGYQQENTLAWQSEHLPEAMDVLRGKQENSARSRRHTCHLAWFLVWNPQSSDADTFTAGYHYAADFSLRLDYWHTGECEFLFVATVSDQECLF